MTVMVILVMKAVLPYQVGASNWGSVRIGHVSFDFEVNSNVLSAIKKNQVERIHGVNHFDGDCSLSSPHFVVAVKVSKD